MSKINKNLRKIDIYTLSLLLCSMFSCNNGDNNYNNSAINNEKLLGGPEEKNPDEWVEPGPDVVGFEKD